MRILNQENSEDLASVWGSDFAKGKIRISWSQTRGCYAIFVSGRMTGLGFDSPEEAKEWLCEIGVNPNRIPN